MQQFLQMPGPNGVLETGITPGLWPRDAKFWLDAENVVFREGGVQSMRGSDEFLEGVDAYLLAQARSGTGPRLYIGTQDGVKYFASNHLYTIESGAAGNDWSMQPYGTWLAYTNGVDDPKLWKAGALSVLPVGATCKILRQLGPHLIAFNIGNEPSKVAWCSADNPDDWDILSISNTAGDLFLRDFSNGIVAAEKCASGIAVYGQDLMGLLTYVGAPYIMGYEFRINGIGAVGKNAVAEVGGSNYGMSRAGIWRTDSLQFAYIDEPDMQQYLQDNVNWDAAERIAAFHHEAMKEVIFSYPAVGSIENNRAVGFNYGNGTWTRYSFGFRAGLERSLFQYPLFSRDGALRTWGSRAESDYSAWAQTKPLDFGDENVYKRIQKLTFGLRGTATLDLGAQERLTDDSNSPVAIDWYDSRSVTSHLPVLEREAPYHTLKLTGMQWKLSGLRVEGEAVGFVT